MKSALPDRLNPGRPVEHPSPRPWWRVGVRLGLLVALLATPAAAQRVRVGIYQNSPKVALSAAGQPEGIFVDLLTAIAEDEGWTLEFVPGTWAESLDRLAAGEIDLLPDVALTAAREAVYAFHREPVLSDWFQIYTRSGSGIRSIPDLNGKRLSLLERSIQEEILSRAFVGFDLNVTLVPQPDYQSAFAAVRRGEADGVIANRFFGAAHSREYQLEDTAIIFNPTRLYFAAPKSGRGALLVAIDRHLVQYKNDPASVYYRSLRHWTSDAVGPAWPPWLKGAGLAAAGLLLFSVLWSVVLKRQVAARTRELAARNEQLDALYAQAQQARQALHDSEQKYRELVEHANSIILRWNADGRVTFLNEYGQRFFGYTAAELTGRHVLGTIVPSTDDRGRAMDRLMMQICADPAAFEQNINENMRRNGERVWVAWTNRIEHNERGEVAEILSVGTDITARKRAEEEVGRLHADLQRHAEQLEHRVQKRTAELAVAKERAEAADRLKSAFLATMSHELRTPLNSIIGFTGILLQELAGPLNPEQHKQLEMVRGSARHLLDLINDVLDISKIEAGQLEVACEAVPMGAVIEKVTGIVRPLADKKGLALRVDLAPGPDTVPGDRRRIEQVLLNLLNNAIKFTERGEVTLTACVTPTPVPAMTIAVADTGIGIKPADLATLFRPFRQIDSGLTRQHDGTGLGLAICRRLAALMQGRIEVESEWGRGSTFTFSLPLNPTPRNHHESEDPAH